MTDFTLTPTGRDTLRVELATGTFEIDGAFVIEIMGFTDDGASNFDMEEIEEAIEDDAAGQEVRLTPEQLQEISAAAVLFLAEGQLPPITKPWCVLVRDVDDEIVAVGGPFATSEQAQTWATAGEEQLLRDVECTRDEFSSTTEEGVLLTDSGAVFYQAVEMTSA